MSLTKIARIVGLSLVVAAAALPAFAVRPCGCTFCQAEPAAPCNDNGTTRVCIDWLASASCPPVG